MSDQPGQPMPNPGIPVEGTLIHSTPILFEDHQVFLRDDQDPDTDLDVVAKRLQRIIDESSGPSWWRPRVARVASQAVRALEEYVEARVSVAEEFLEAQEEYESSLSALIAGSEKAQDRLIAAKTLLESLAGLIDAKDETS